MKYQCIQCTTVDENGGNVVEFDSRADWLAHTKSHKEGTVTRAPRAVETPEELPVALPPSPPAEVPRKPIVLEYKYNGECELCGSPVDTLHVDLDGAHVAIAYCPKDRLQITQRKVIPLDEQFKDNGKKSIR